VETVSFLLGRPMGYWLELHNRFTEGSSSVRAEDLLQEVVTLRGKLAFYDARVAEMAKIMERK
jgi:hypothetical protein